MNSAVCAFSARIWARSASSRSRARRSPSSADSAIKPKVSGTKQNSCCGICKRRLLRFIFVSGGVQVGGEVTAVSPARVLVAGSGNSPAWVLPHLAAVVPMETEFRQSGGDLVRLFAVKLNPYPPSNHFRQFPKLRCLPANKVQKRFRPQCPVPMPAVEINSLQFVPVALCGPVLEL